MAIPSGSATASVIEHATMRSNINISLLLLWHIWVDLRTRAGDLSANLDIFIHYYHNIISVNKSSLFFERVKSGHLEGYKILVSYPSPRIHVQIGRNRQNRQNGIASAEIHRNRQIQAGEGGIGDFRAGGQRRANFAGLLTHTGIN